MGRSQGPCPAFPPSPAAATDVPSQAWCPQPHPVRQEVPGPGDTGSPGPPLPVTPQTPTLWTPPAHRQRSPPCSGWRTSCRPASACRGGPSASSWSACSRLPSDTGSAGPSRASSNTGGQAGAGWRPALGGVGPTSCPDSPSGSICGACWLPSPGEAPRKQQLGNQASPGGERGAAPEQTLTLKPPSPVSQASDCLVSTVKETVVTRSVDGGQSQAQCFQGQQGPKMPNIQGLRLGVGWVFFFFFLHFRGSRLRYHPPQYNSSSPVHPFSLCG